MTHERRVVRRTIRIQDDHQAIPTGHVVAAQLRRDYPDDPVALKLDLYVETTGEWADDIVVVIGTDRPVPEQGDHLATVVDEGPRGDPIAWHLYRIGTAGRDAELDTHALVAMAAASQARHRRTCGATPGTEPVVVEPGPGEEPWRIVCGEEPGHDPSNYHTPHRARGLGSHGRGEFTWHEGRP